MEKIHIFILSFFSKKIQGPDERTLMLIVAYLALRWRLQVSFFEAPSLGIISLERNINPWCLNQETQSLTPWALPQCLVLMLP